MKLLFKTYVEQINESDIFMCRPFNNSFFIDICPLVIKITNDLKSIDKQEITISTVINID